MNKSSEIVGCLNLQNFAEGGAVFEVKHVSNEKTEDELAEEAEITDALQSYLKLECLDFGETYDGNEPFSNIAESMQNLLQNGKVKKRILREGYGSKPEQSSCVNIHYNAYVQNEAQPFDSTYARKKPFSFKIGEGEVIEGLDAAVFSMRLNEKAQFLIDPELAYRSGVPGRVPKDSIVLFEIELCDVQQLTDEHTPDVNDKQFEVAYPKCLALSGQAKRLVKLKDYQSAIKIYKTAVDKLEEAILNDYDEQMKSEELLVRLYTNLLVCCTNAQIPKRGCIYAQKIYEMAQNKTFQVPSKVYFNHAKCQRMLGGFEQAKRKLLQAKSLEPNNPEILQELNTLDEVRKNHLKKEKNMGQALVNSQ